MQATTLTHNREPQPVLFMPLHGYYKDTVEKCCYFFNEEGVIKFALDYQMFFSIGTEFFRLMKRKVQSAGRGIVAIGDSKGEELYNRSITYVHTKKQAS